MIPVTTVKFMPLMPAFIGPVKNILQRHGGTLEVSNGFCLASFPPGTFKEEVPQLRVHDVRYEITFPDGYKVWETVGRDTLHTLAFIITDFPDELRKKFKNLIECTTRNT